MTHNGDCKTLASWFKVRGIPQGRIWGRVARLGWSTEEALEFTPRQSRKSRPYSPLTIALTEMGLAGTRSYDKFIPAQYMKGSVQQRLELLQGLFDTDGSVGEGGTYAVYTTCSEHLAKGVQEIAWSLGAVVRISTCVNWAGFRAKRPTYKVLIRHPDIKHFFSLPRKVARTKQLQFRLRLRLESVIRVGRKTTRCILIDHPDHLYVTDDYIVTHNSIEAGPIVELTRRALGKEQMPEILTTLRQKTEREQKIAALFRAGRVDALEQALTMKREDGTAEMVPGGYRDVVARVAALAAERWRANADNPKYSLNISAPTNADAHELGTAIREERRRMGEVGEDSVAIKAVDNAGAEYRMRLAPGDRVRLFSSTRVTGQGGSIGRNGSVLKVITADGKGMVVKNAKGNQGYIPWAALTDKGGRIKLAYGEARTTHSAQGSTSTEHIYALPAGTKSVTGFSAYSSATRHRINNFMVFSAGAEQADVTRRRPLNDIRPIREADAWENVARNLGRQPEKELAIDMLEKSGAVRQGAAKTLQRGAGRAQGRERAGEEPTVLHHAFARSQEAAAVRPMVERLGKATERQRLVMERLARIGPAVMQAVRQRVEQIRHAHGRGREPTVRH